MQKWGAAKQFERQRWRCIAPGKEFHHFTGGAAHTHLATPGLCTECDNSVSVHEGPVAGFAFEYRVREIAEALTHVGRGMTYTEAARRARKTANIMRQMNEPGWTPRPENLSNGQTVAEWVGEFTPVVGSRHAETQWPQTLVLDSTVFKYTNTWTGRQRQLFTVMSAYGYEAGQATGRMWKVWASPDGDGNAWAEFLRLLPGRPDSIVCDDDKAIKDGVRQRWGRGRSAVPVHQCEHHLAVNGWAALDADGIAYGDPTRTLFDTALQSLTGWDTFVAAVNADPRAHATRRWVRHWNPVLRVQTARRPSIPPHYANGAIEEPQRTIRNAIDHRKFCFRNRERMILLLELMRLSANKDDIVRVYSEDIRSYLTNADPERTRAYRGIYDTWGPSDATNPRTRIYSLFGETAVEWQWR